MTELIIIVLLALTHYSPVPVMCLDTGDEIQCSIKTDKPVMVDAVSGWSVKARCVHGSQMVNFEDLGRSVRFDCE